MDFLSKAVNLQLQFPGHVPGKFILLSLEPLFPFRRLGFHEIFCQPGIFFHKGKAVLFHCLFLFVKPGIELFQISFPAIREIPDKFGILFHKGGMVFFHCLFFLCEPSVEL